VKKKISVSSYSYAKKAYNENEKIAGMINADVIGNNTYQNADHNIMRAYSNNQARWVVEIMQQVNSTYNIGLNVIKQDNYHGNSDDKAFDDYGYGSMQIFQSAFNMEEFYGKANDTIELININYATDITKVITATLVSIANAEKTLFIQIVTPEEDKCISNSQVTGISYPYGTTQIKSKISTFKRR